MSGPPDRLAVKIYDGGGAKASKRCGCCEGIEKGKGVQCIAFYSRGVPRMEKIEIQRDLVLSTMESFGCLSITRKMTILQSRPWRQSHKRGSQG
jgi:hypothetical protein